MSPDQNTQTKQVDPAKAQEQTGEAPTKEALMEQGAVVYEKQCAVCHQLSGQGQGIFPSLIGSKVATGPVQPHIYQLLFGKNAMPAFKNILSYEEIAAVITYVRNMWGNDDQQKYGPDAGGVYTAKDVEAIYLKSKSNQDKGG